MKRVDVPPEVLRDCRRGEELRLPDDTAHYIANVLRRAPGDKLELFDGAGLVVVIELVSVDDGVVAKVLDSPDPDENESPVETVLFQAIPKGKRWKWLLEKTTELGVDRIVPLETRHTIVQIPDDRLEKKLDRWNRVLASAARQCGRLRVPSIEAPLDVDAALEEDGSGLHIVADPDDQSPPIADLVAGTSPAPSSVGLWIGPEGGWTDEELEKLTSRAVCRVDMGPRILRAETAGIVAVALIQSTLGDL